MSLRVLVADDHAPTRASVRATLDADERFTVCAEACDAAGAIQEAVHHRPDICLLDVHMPGSGIAAAWEISARLPGTAIVMLTVSDADPDLFGSLRAGVAGYLLKDIDPRRLPDALLDVADGRAALPRPLISRVMAQFRDPSAKWRKPVAIGEAPRLTSREWEVFELMQQDLTTSQIARRLMLSVATVRSHRARIARKLGRREQRSGESSPATR